MKNRFGPDGVTFPVRMDTSKGIVKIYDPNSPEGDKLKETMASGEANMRKFLSDKLKGFQTNEA